MNIVLGVTGSIAAYKAADITSSLTKRGHNIDVILTENGSKIITPITLQTLSKNKVYMEIHMFLFFDYYIFLLSKCVHIHFNHIFIRHSL